MRTWVCVSGQRVEIVLPFLSKCRADSGRCCQTCTPMSWDDFYSKHLPSLGFRDISRVTEKDTRFRGWLVRRVCALLAVCSWEVPADTPGDLAARVCRSRRVRDVAPARGLREDDGWGRRWKGKVLELLGDIQGPLSLLMLRICHWALLKLLSRLFLSVQLHRGQLEMVLRAASTVGTRCSRARCCAVPPARRALSPAPPLQPHVPLVFLSTHKSQLDGPLLSFVLFSQGLGVPRVTVGAQGCSPRLRSLLRRLGGIFLPSRMEQTPSDPEDALPGAVLAARGAQPLSIGACLWAAFRALRRNLGCVRVDFAQPFSLQEFVAKSHVRHAGKPEEPLLLLPTILGTWPSQLDAGNTEVWAPGPTTATGLEAPEEVLVTSLGLHSLSDSMSCSAIMSVGITSALLLHKYREGVFLSRLMRDFAWLLEEILLRQHDVGFSGQLRVLVQHSLILLRARLSLYHLSPLGDILVVPKASAETWMELGQHSAAILPVFASEAVGACAIRALLAEMLPFLEPPTSASSIIFSQDELHRKTLELLRLLPPTLLGLRPCQPLDCWSEDIVDKLVLCGLLEPEEAEGEHWVCDTAPRPFSRRQPWPRMDFSDSESEDEAPACRCFKVPAVGGSPLSPPRGEGALPELRVPPVQLGEPQGSPLFLLFLCRLLSPALRTYAGAVAFLEQSRWPQPEAAYVEELLQFLAKEGSELPNGSLALSSLQTFKEMGVLEEVGGPPGPLLHLAQPFRSSASRERLEAFIQQFIQP
ncbi:glycerol-3-phosphate acyltransferase 2, mitochondrial isoform X6 [Strigops habroptila]|uniref:glycerol-3-phosphate acyltransferase 2, mitochondrial isoform X6 n=1 Tax=Strigops habroptila TaxID=2489341 RepID=UPI0011CF0B91|nr:glycerol-3-phosphate acyltransferase 2, mitochondrial isoform X6 [Strigops habroptila]